MSYLLITAIRSPSKLSIYFTHLYYKHAKPVKDTKITLLHLNMPDYTCLWWNKEMLGMEEKVIAVVCFRTPNQSACSQK